MVYLTALWNMPLLLFWKYFYCCSEDVWAASSQTVQRKERLRLAPPCVPQASPCQIWHSFRALSLCPVLPLLSGSPLSLPRSMFVGLFLHTAIELVSHTLVLATALECDSFTQEHPAVESWNTPLLACQSFNITTFFSQSEWCGFFSPDFIINIRNCLCDVIVQLHCHCSII